MEIYWQIHPARMTRLADMQSFAGANLIHRFVLEQDSHGQGASHLSRVSALEEVIKAFGKRASMLGIQAKYFDARDAGLFLDNRSKVEIQTQ